MGSNQGLKVQKQQKTEKLLSLSYIIPSVSKLDL
jgi:hypothetical protein